MNNNAPIGIFDSGVGGLSIWKEINQLLPNEQLVYLADSKHAPYGPKGKEKIIEYSIKNTELLLQKGCKLIVVACNTATTNAISILRNKYQLPFIGIEPATKPAILATKTGVIGILATKGTLASELFYNTSQKHKGDTVIVEQEGIGLVDIVESGDLDAAIPLLKTYLQPMLNAGADNIVLGCTHYPFLKPLISQLVPSNVQIIDSGLAVAKQTKNVLETHSLRSNIVSSVKHIFYTNKDVGVLNRFISDLSVESFESSFLEF